jgi:hypothetical protein
MTQQLREELDALAHTQSFSPDPSAWDRGRRARRRDRALAVVAAALVVVAGFGGAALWSTSDREARTASTDVVGDVGVGAIPRRIEDISSDLEPSPDLTVGRGAAAFISTSQRVPVVITATDGVSQRLDLPGWTGDSQALALSPDGLRLAWQDAGTSGATISVLELMTGNVWSQEVHPDGDLSLRELTWSPDSVWLAWIGDADGGAQVGRLRPVYAPMPLSWFVQGNVASVAVGDDARLVVSRAGGGLFLLRGDEAPQRLADAGSVGAGLWAPDGRHIALRSGLGAASYTFDTTTGEVLEHPFPDGTVDSAVVMPLGWLDDRHQVLQVWASEGGDAQLVVTTPRVGTASTWRGSVGSIDSTVAGRVTLAVELMPDLDGTSSQELTHDFGDTTPDRPRPPGIELSLIIGLGVAAAIASVLGLRWLRRRPT